MSAITETLIEAVNAWDAFDDPDTLVDGTALVEWFSEWRERAKAALAEGIDDEDYEEVDEYHLTDGEETFEIKYMTSEQAEEANRLAQDITDGNLTWGKIINADLRRNNAH